MYHQRDTSAAALLLHTYYWTAFEEVCIIRAAVLTAWCVSAINTAHP